MKVPGAWHCEPLARGCSELFIFLLLPSLCSFSSFTLGDVACFSLVPGSGKIPLWPREPKSSIPHHISLTNISTSLLLKKVCWESTSVRQNLPLWAALATLCFEPGSKGTLPPWMSLAPTLAVSLEPSVLRPLLLPRYMHYMQIPHIPASQIPASGHLHFVSSFLQALISH